MDVLADIRQKLLSGKQPIELVKDGYARSSVYHVSKQLRSVQSVIPSPTVDDEVMELRRRKEIVKLERDIADLEADKQKLPERVAKLETNFQELKDDLFNLWAHQCATAMKELECPHHGHSMGVVIKCRQQGCEHQLGFGWKD